MNSMAFDQLLASFFLCWSLRRVILMSLHDFQPVTYSLVIKKQHTLANAHTHTHDNVSLFSLSRLPEHRPAESRVSSQGCANDWVSLA
jgi:hypothetical protein